MYHKGIFKNYYYYFQDGLLPAIDPINKFPASLLSPGRHKDKARTFQQLEITNANIFLGKENTLGEF